MNESNSNLLHNLIWNEMANLNNINFDEAGQNSKTITKKKNDGKEEFNIFFQECALDQKIGKKISGSPKFIRKSN